LYAALQKCAAAGKDLCALHNRGWDNTVVFANSVGVAFAKSQIFEADSQIKALFQGYQADLFAPYQNSVSPDLIQALNELGYYGLSGLSATLPWSTSTSPTLQLPAETATGLYSNVGLIATPTSKNLADCQAADALGQQCVILVQSDEFANGVYTIPQLQTLVNTLTSNGFTGASFNSVFKSALGGAYVPTPALPAPPATPVGKKRFIFRLDGIQDFYNSPTQIALLNFFISNNFGVSAGIIGNYLTGGDVPLYNALKQCAALPKSQCALFNRGSDAVFNFVTTTGVANAKGQICGADQVIQTLFNGYQAEVFAPFQNGWTQDLIQALFELGYRGLSAAPTLAWSTSTVPLQLPNQAQTGQVVNGVLTGVPVSQIISDCEGANSAGQDCVILVQPDEFASGAFTLANLQSLTTALTANGWTSINFDTTITEVLGAQPVNPPPTAAPTQLPPTAPPTTAPNVAAAWAKCGGFGWTGATSCATGFSCISQSVWYSQCVPSATSVPQTGVDAWGQCGGQGYTGPTQCLAKLTCTYVNDWWSSCQPSRRLRQE
jgi:hypothetical protein